MIISNRKGISWYRGYFKEDLRQEQVDNTLAKFGVKSVVVGHTLQDEVTALYDGRVVAIDVRHPGDYRKSWPSQQSEGLWISDDKMYRVLADGRRILLN